MSKYKGISTKLKQFIVRYSVEFKILIVISLVVFFFIVLGMIGSNMVYESYKEDKKVNVYEVKEETIFTGGREQGKEFENNAIKNTDMNVYIDSQSDDGMLSKGSYIVKVDKDEEVNKGKVQIEVSYTESSNIMESIGIMFNPKSPYFVGDVKLVYNPKEYPIKDKVVER